MRRRLLVLATSIAGGLALAAVAAASNGGVGPVPPVSPNGHRITDAYWVILGVLAVVFVVVEAALLTFVIRYRRRGRPRDAEPEQIHGDTRIEIAWTVAPVLLLAVIVAFVFYKLPGIKNAPASRRERTTSRSRRTSSTGCSSTRAAAQSINVLTVPEGPGREPRRGLAPTSRTAGGFRAFGGKIDAIPGKTNHTWFKAEKAGTYAIRCAEFCGIQHTGMRGFVRVTEPGSRRTGRAARQAGVRRRLRVVPRPRRRGGIGPAIASSPTLQNPEALSALVHERRRDDAGGRQHLGRDGLINALART